MIPISGAAILVLESLDVVFAKIVPGLHLDDLKVAITAILQFMEGLPGDVG
jgi:hypothetical protein